MFCCMDAGSILPKTTVIKGMATPEAIEVIQHITIRNQSNFLAYEKTRYHRKLAIDSKRQWPLTK
jgi:hypothetical protein